jgi:quercetin dioxygenase-like cupin family protein
MLKTFAAFASVLAASSVGLAQQMAHPLNSTDMKCGAAPKVFPPGAQIAIVSDPFKDGLYVVRMKLPAGYKIPAHNHPTAEYVTVISGTVQLGMGDKLDPQKGIALRPGGFAEAPAKMNHYAWADEGIGHPSAWARPVHNHLCESSGRSQQALGGRAGRAGASEERRYSFALPCGRSSHTA